MTANVSLNQSVHLRQAASDYLSQCYQISAHVKDLIDELKTAEKDLQLGSLIPALEKYLETFQISIKESHNELDVEINPYPSLQYLYIYQKRGADLLKEAADDLAKLSTLLHNAADDISLFDGFESYSHALAKEVAHA